MIQKADALETTRSIARNAAVRAGLAVFQLTALDEFAKSQYHASRYRQWLWRQHDDQISRLIGWAAEEVESRLDTEVAKRAAPAVAEVVEYVDHALRSALHGEARVTSVLTWWPRRLQIGTCDIAGAIVDRMNLLASELEEDTKTMSLAMEETNDR